MKEGRKWRLREMCLTSRAPYKGETALTRTPGAAPTATPGTPPVAAPGAPPAAPTAAPGAGPGGGNGDRVLPGRNLKGTDPRLAEIVSAAARGLPPGYKIQATSGMRDPSAPGFHPHGKATDWQIIGPDGKPISNRGEDTTGLYTQLARNAYGYQEKHYPELTGKFQWGGQFGTSRRNPNEPDLMHFDIGGRRGRLTRYSREKIGAIYPPTGAAKTATPASSAPPPLPTKKDVGYTPVPPPSYEDGPPISSEPDLSKYQQLREDLERPIRMSIEAPSVPSQLTPQFRRATARNETNREFRDARWSSYSDIGAA
jgi:hypothetical protein